MIQNPPPPSRPKQVPFIPPIPKAASNAATLSGREVTRSLSASTSSLPDRIQELFLKLDYPLSEDITREFSNNYSRIQNQFLTIASEALKRVQDGQILDAKDVDTLSATCELSELIRSHLQQTADMEGTLNTTQGERALQLARQKAELFSVIKAKEIELQKAVQEIEHQQEIHRLEIEAGAHEQRLKEEEQNFQHDLELIRTTYHIRNQSGQHLNEDVQQNIFFQAAVKGNDRLIKALLNLGMKIDSKGNDGLTALARAVKEGDLTASQILKCNGANPKCEDDSYGTLLHLAVIPANLAFLKLVFSWVKNEWLEKKDTHGRTPFFLAVQQRWKEGAQWLYEQRSSLHEIDEDGRSALHICCIGGSDDILEWLLQFNKLPLKALDDHEQDPLDLCLLHGHPVLAQRLVTAGVQLHYGHLKAAAAQGQVKSVEWLLTQNIPLDETEDIKETPIAVAIGGGHLEAVKLLIPTGPLDPFHLHLACSLGMHQIVYWFLENLQRVNIETCNSEGLSPLQGAMRAGHTRVAQALIRAGASTQILDSSQNTLLHLTVKSGNKDCVSWLCKKYASFINLKNAEGQTPLAVAVSAGHILIAQLLHQSGGQIAVRDKKNQTLLHLTTSLQMLQWLLPLLSDDLDVRNVEGCTALLLIVRRGDVSAARLLVERRASITICDDEGQTLLDYAIQSRSLAAVEWAYEICQGVFQGQEWRLKAMKLAISLNLKSIAQYLHRQGIPVNGEHLYIAVTKQFPDMVEWLLSLNVDPFFIFNSNPTVLHLALFSSSEEVRRSFYRLPRERLCDPKTGDTPLHVVAREGDCSMIEQWLRLGHLINIENKKKESPLVCAVKAGKIEAANKLKERGASTYCETFGGKCLLHYAVESGSIGLVQLVYQWHPINHSKVDIEGRTPLMQAIWDNNREAVRFLFQQNPVSCVKVNGNEMPLLIWATICRLPIIPFLLTLPHMDKACTYLNLNLLQWSVMIGQIATLESLAAEGANLLVTTENGKSLLHIAVISAQAPVIEWILSNNNIRTNILGLRDNEGHTALEIMLICYHFRETQEKILNAFKAHINATELYPLCRVLVWTSPSYMAALFCRDQQTVVHLAAERGDRELLTSLGKYQIILALTLKDGQGHTPLARAVLASKIDIARLLIEFGASLNELDSIIQPTTEIATIIAVIKQGKFREAE